jgi:hypothetical protein
MGFFRDLVTEGTGVSSKRFISLIGMLVFIGVTIVVCTGVVVPTDVILALTTITIGSNALTLFNKKPDGKQE